MTELTKLLFSMKGVFTNVVARWPGRTHESHVFRTSNICTYLQNTHRSLEDGVLLGDSGYASSPFLMTPYTTTRNEAQEAYNNAHAKTRVIIEQTFGRWKRRFHVLHGEIRMAPKKDFMDLNWLRLVQEWNTIFVPKGTLLTLIFFFLAVSSPALQSMLCTVAQEHLHGWSFA